MMTTQSDDIYIFPIDICKGTQYGKREIQGLFCSKKFVVESVKERKVIVKKKNNLSMDINDVANINKWLTDYFETKEMELFNDNN